MKSLRRFLGMEKSSKAARVPPGYRLYAVGDVHGRDDLLEELLDRIEADHRSRPAAKLAIVFLGDLIDRGPSSAQVVERLLNYRPDDARLVFLAGNHEEVMLRVIDGELGLIPEWLRFGGMECLASYGVGTDAIRGATSRKLLSVIREAIPSKHVAFIRSFEDTFRAGDYLFVHAGIRPGVPLGEQARSDLLWIREPFLSDPSDHGFLVVHGHTIRETIEEATNRIGIDTGAYRHGLLSALALEDANRWYLQASKNHGFESELKRKPSIPSTLDAVSGQSG